MLKTASDVPIEYNKETIWTLFNSDGYIEKNGVEVMHYPLGITRINATQHATDELIIYENRIETTKAGWYLER